MNENNFKTCSGSSSGSVETSLYCIEMPAHRAATEEDGDFIVLTWINVLKEGPIEKRYKYPGMAQTGNQMIGSKTRKKMDLLEGKSMTPLLGETIFSSFPLSNLVSAPWTFSADRAAFEDL